MKPLVVATESQDTNKLRKTNVINCSKLHPAADGTLPKSLQQAHGHVYFILQCKCAVGQ